MASSSKVTLPRGNVIREAQERVLSQIAPRVQDRVTKRVEQSLEEIKERYLQGATEGREDGIGDSLRELAGLFRIAEVKNERGYGEIVLGIDGTTFGRFVRQLEFGDGQTKPRPNVIPAVRRLMQDIEESLPRILKEEMKR